MAGTLRSVAAAAGGILLVAFAIVLVVFDGSGASSNMLLAGPDPQNHLPSASSTARSAMPSSWLSSGDEKSSPLLQDSSDNAVQTLATPGAVQRPAPVVSLAARDSPPARSSPPSSPAVTNPPATAAPAPTATSSASVSASRSSKLGAKATELSGKLASLPQVDSQADSPATFQKAATDSKPSTEERNPISMKSKVKVLQQEHSPWSKAPANDRWKRMVQKAEAAADELAKEHPRSVLGAHWRHAVPGDTATLEDASAAATKAGHSQQEQLVQLAKDNLKQKGIYAPAAMCEKDNLPCPGTLRAQETSTGHYAPVRDNGPAPGQKAKAAKKAQVKLMPVRYPAVSFYAKVREELSSKESARLAATPSHRISLDLLAPGQLTSRPAKDVEEHREREERRDDEKRRKEDELRDEREQQEDREDRKHREEREEGKIRRQAQDVSREVNERDSARSINEPSSINEHLYKLFIEPSSLSNRREEDLLERETRPSDKDLKARDSIESIEGSKLYQAEMDDDDYDPREEQQGEMMRHEMRVKQAQERMAARWRQMMANPPPRTRSTRPDMLDPRELHIPREGFKAKKKELDDFKNAIEMYEADPELNPVTIIQAHHLAKYGVMPPESDNARDWQAWYRQATDMAQQLSEQVAALAMPLVDARHRWDHGHPGDWCGTGGCRTLAHEERGDRFVERKPPAPDALEKSITEKMEDAVLSGEDAGGKMPAEVTISHEAALAPAGYAEGEEDRRHTSSLRSRGIGYVNERVDGRYADSEEWRDKSARGEERGKAMPRMDGNDEAEGREYDREYGSSSGLPERDAVGHDDSIRAESGYRERESRYRDDEHREARERGGVKQLASKVDELQDEMRHLVKILARRKLSEGREEGGGRYGRRDDDGDGDRSRQRIPETSKEHDGVVRMGNTASGRHRRDAREGEGDREGEGEGRGEKEEAKAEESSPAENARLAARHVVDWLRGASLAAKF